MKILAIDLGTKRHGLAVSDLKEILATPLFSFDARGEKKDTEKILNIIRNKNIEKILFGLPKNLDGEDTDMTSNVLDFSKSLRNKLNSNALNKIEIDFIDESLTSKKAEEILRGKGIKNKKEQKKTIDSIAASIFLQDYLDF
ncbi:MAG: Holliday junction resolvase RuvX [Clostridiales Family XIII bacterium]|nr:Holliday junction resolvase RuvX [Clostridiales Family XIII bacterium]